MPTRDRRVFVSQALRYFLRQDYPDAELIVVDDGYDAVEDLMVDDERILYVRLEGVHSIGAKRNLACRHASGEIIAHWDDDDWSAPERLRRQVDAMLSAGADVCGLRELLHYRALRGDAFLYRGATDCSASIAGCSIVYRRELLNRGGYPDLSLGEDSAFVRRLPGDRVLALGDRSLMVAVVHGRNVSALPLGTRQWEPAEVDEVGELLGSDRAFYTRLRGGKAPAAPRPRPATELSVVAHFNVSTGYGATAEYLALSLARAGASVHLQPLGLYPEGLSEELLGLIRSRPGSSSDRATIIHSWLRPDLPPLQEIPNAFVSTMWEATRLPTDWVHWLSLARAVIVPSTFVARTCSESGVGKPIAVLPLGVDPDVYHWQPRDDREGIVTLIVAPVGNTAGDRKYTLGAIEAWKRAFAGDAGARLVIKTTYGFNNYVPDDPRIEYVDRAEPTRGIAHWYRRADVLLAIGSEGFGMPLVEGMATGMPVIALDAGGQADVCRAAPDLVLRVPPAGSESHVSEDQVTGSRSRPDFDAVVGHLRWVDRNRDEAREMGRAASAWALEHRNIWSFGPAVLDVVHGAPGIVRRRPARRTLWVPSVGRACGLAAYTERLRRNLPSAQITASEPPFGRAAVVHIQHQHTLFDDSRLEQFVARARARGTEVVITEHCVVDRPNAWEPGAGALVATTRAAAARLRARCSEVAVVHIPLGCETWSFPRKACRGRTIGFFGFPAPHKGCARLAAALRSLPGCDAVMFAHTPPHNRLAAVDWPPAVPVRWNSNWLPLAEIAAALAATADVLVFHYDEIAETSASSAVLLGLSTGVPVLTSATTWFADLGDAVHRAAAQSDALAAELERLLEDDELRDRTTDAAREYCEANSWSRTAARHVDLWNSLKTV